MRCGLCAGSSAHFLHRPDLSASASASLQGMRPSGAEHWPLPPGALFPPAFPVQRQQGGLPQVQATHSHPACANCFPPQVSGHFRCQPLQRWRPHPAQSFHRRAPCTDGGGDFLQKLDCRARIHQQQFSFSQRVARGCGGRRPARRCHVAGTGWPGKMGAQRPRAGFNPRGTFRAPPRSSWLGPPAWSESGRSGLRAGARRSGRR